MSIEQANDDFTTARVNYTTGLDHAARASEQCGAIAEQTGKLLPGLREFVRVVTSKEVNPEGLADTTKEMLAAFAVGHSALQQAVGENTTDNPRLATMLANSETVNDEDLGSTLTTETARIEEAMLSFNSIISNLPALGSLLESLEWLNGAANRTTIMLNLTQGNSQRIINDIKPGYEF